jgi:hypothetical protein
VPGSGSSEGGGRDYEEVLAEQGYRRAVPAAPGGAGAWDAVGPRGLDGEEGGGGNGSRGLEEEEEVDEEDARAYRESAAWRRQLMMD